MKKLMNKKGFTLMEMLIVVAIIVILVAISVPTFTANLGEAKAATDAANLRAAKSAAQVWTINHDVTASTVLYYDAEAGNVVDSSAADFSLPAGYGECSTHAKTSTEGAALVKITFDSNKNATYSWVRSASGTALGDCTQ